MQYTDQAFPALKGEGSRGAYAPPPLAPPSAKKAQQLDENGWAHEEPRLPPAPAPDRAPAPEPGSARGGRPRADQAFPAPAGERSRGAYAPAPAAKAPQLDEDGWAHEEPKQPPAPAGEHGRGAYAPAAPPAKAQQLDENGWAVEEEPRQPPAPARAPDRAPAPQPGRARADSRHTNGAPAVAVTSTIGGSGHGFYCTRNITEKCET